MNLSRTRIVALIALLALECCLLWAAFSDWHVDKPGTGSAWFAWRQHPSPETEAAWLAEKRKVRIQELASNCLIWSLIVATAAGVYYVSRAQKRPI